MTSHRYFAVCMLLLPALSVPGQSQKAAGTHAPAQHGYSTADGSIRIVGNAVSEGAIKRLDALFEAAHPGLTLYFIPANDAASIDSLIFDSTLVAPVASVYGGGIAYSDIVKAAPFAVRIAHASIAPNTRLGPLAVIVNPANPAHAFSLDRIASIFTKPLRSAVISHWSQIGLKIPNADEIEPAGLPWTDHYFSEDPSFGEETFYRRLNGAPPVDSYHVFPTYAEAVSFVAREAGAIAIVPANLAGANVRVVGLVSGLDDEIRMPTKADIQSGHYPLDRGLYLYARVVKGAPLDPLALDYLKIALSPAGQAAIADGEEGFIPLNATEVGEEQAKLQ